MWTNNVRLTFTFTRVRHNAVSFTMTVMSPVYYYCENAKMDMTWHYSHVSFIDRVAGQHANVGYHLYEIKRYLQIRLAYH